VIFESRGSSDETSSIEGVNELKEFGLDIHIGNEVAEKLFDSALDDFLRREQSNVEGIWK
jgi:hypothetical protein